MYGLLEVVLINVNLCLINLSKTIRLLGYFSISEKRLAMSFISSRARVSSLLKLMVLIP